MQAKTPVSATNTAQREAIDFVDNDWVEYESTILEKSPVPPFLRTIMRDIYFLGVLNTAKAIYRRDEADRPTALDGLFRLAVIRTIETLPSELALDAIARLKKELDSNEVCAEAESAIAGMKGGGDGH